VRRLPATLALLAAFILALPAAAAAQGAGDEQYRDPFAGEQPPEQQAPAQTGSGSAPADDSAGTGAGVAQAPSAPAGQSAPAATLPRTGFAGVLLLLAYGWALLVGGAALRRLA
jgi:hypothetical protein